MEGEKRIFFLECRSFSNYLYLYAVAKMLKFQRLGPEPQNQLLPRPIQPSTFELLSMLWARRGGSKH